MPRLLKTPAPAAKIKVNKDSKNEEKTEEYQTLTQSRTRRTPKPNPKYNDSMIATPKALRAELENDEEDSIDQQPTPQPTKKLIPKKETPAPVTETRATRSRPATTIIEGSSTKLHSKVASVPAPKKQKLDFDKDIDEEQEDNEIEEVQAKKKPEIKSGPVITRMTRITRSNEGTTANAAASQSKASPVANSQSQKSSATAVVSSAGKTDERDKGRKTNSPAATITTLRSGLKSKAQQKTTVASSPTGSALSLRSGQKTNSPAGAVLKNDRKTSSSPAATLKNDKQSCVKDPEIEIRAIESDTETDQPIKEKEKKAKGSATNKDAEEKGKSATDSSYVTFVDINKIIQKNESTDDQEDCEEMSDDTTTITPPPHSPSPVKKTKEEKSFVSKAREKSKIVVGSSASGIRRKPDEEGSPQAKRFKLSDEKEKVIVKKTSASTTPTVLVKKSTPATRPIQNNGKLTKLQSSQPPRILNSSVMAATKQSNTVKLLNTSTANNKMFSIDLTEDENSDNISVGEMKKSPLVHKTSETSPPPVLLNKGLKNSSNLVNKTLVHEKLNKSLNDSLKTFRENNNNNSKSSNNINRLKLVNTPSPTSTATKSSKRSNEMVSQIGNTKKVTKFESWHIIECPKMEIEPQKHVHSVSLVKLGNALNNLNIPEKWDHKVVLQKKSEKIKKIGTESSQDGELQNKTETQEEDEIYTGEITDIEVKEEDRKLYEPQNIIFKRTQKNGNRLVIDRSLNVRDKKYSITIDGKSCCLIGAPEELNSTEGFSILLEILDSVSIKNSCVELVHPAPVSLVDKTVL